MGASLIPREPFRRDFWAFGGIDQVYRSFPLGRVAELGTGNWANFMGVGSGERRCVTL